VRGKKVHFLPSIRRFLLLHNLSIPDPINLNHHHFARMRRSINIPLHTRLPLILHERVRIDKREILFAPVRPGYQNLPGQYKVELI